MDLHLPFLKAIAANPPDDLPRMVYADFLEETGEPAAEVWAEFIRLHVTGEDSGRLAVLTNRHLPSWFAHLRAALINVCDARFDIVRWRGGFPDVVEMREADLRRAAALFSLWPVWGLRPLGEYTFAGFDELSFLLKLARLEVRSLQLPLVALAAGHRWVELPTLSNLRSLSFAHDDRLTDDWLVEFVSALQDASFVAGMVELDLTRCFQITDAGANTLATAYSLSRLKTLRLTGVPLSPASIAMLRRRFGDGLVV